MAIRQNYKDPFNDMDCTMAFEEGHGVPTDTRVNVKEFTLVLFSR